MKEKQKIQQYKICIKNIASQAETKKIKKLYSIFIQTQPLLDK